MASRIVYGFGPFAYSAERGLSRGGEDIPLPPRVQALLHRLLAARGAFVTRDELLQAIAPEGGSPKASLWRAIHLLRKALADHRLEIVRTAYGRGVRIGLPVSEAEGPAAAPPPPAPPPPASAASGEDMIRTAFEICSVRTEKNLQLAAAVLASALEHFPRLALAASLQADLEVVRMMRGYVRPLAAVPKTLQLIDRALAITPDFGPALATKGWVAGTVLDDAATGHRLIDQALRATPENWLACFYKVWLLIGDRNLAEAAAVLDRALQVSPLERSLISLRAWIMAAEQRYADALAYIARVGALRPDVEFLWIIECMVQLREGNPAAAHDSMAKAVALYPNDPFMKVNAAWLDAASGRTTEAVAYLARKPRSAGGYANPVLEAMIRHALGDRLGADNLLRIAEAEKDPWRLLAWCDPRFGG